MNVKNSANKMAILNVTDSGGSTKKKPSSKTSKPPEKSTSKAPPQLFIIPPNIVSAVKSSFANSPQKAPAASLPNPLQAAPSLSQPLPWQTNNGKSLLEQNPYKNLKLDKPPDFSFTDTQNAFDNILSNSSFYSKDVPAAKNNKKNIINSALSTAVMPKQPNFDNNALVTANPFINHLPNEKKVKSPQLYSFPEMHSSQIMPKTKKAQERNAKLAGENFLYSTEKLLNGAVISPLESIADLVSVPLFSGLSLLASAGGPVQTDLSRGLTSTANYFATDDVSGNYSKNIDKRYPNASRINKPTGDFVQGVGNMLTIMLPSVAAAKAIPFANKLINSSKYLSKVYPYLANVFYAIDSGGKGMEKAAIEGAGTNQAVLAGLTSAAFGSFSQKLSGGMPYMGNGKLSEWLKKATDSPVLKNLIDVVGEGGEGALRAFFEPLSTRFIYNKDQPLATGEELWENFLQDGAMSLLLKFSTGQLDFRTKYDNTVNTKSKAQEYIDEGSKAVESAEAMPDAKIIFGKAYSNSTDQFKKLANAFDRAGNKLYNELADSASNPLFAQQTRADLANAAIEATQTSIFKEQLNSIENALGKDAEPFINGLCEDMLNDIAIDLANGKAISEKIIEGKILSYFTNAVQLVQEYKQGFDLNTQDFSASIKNQLKNVVFNKKSYVEYGYNFDNFGYYVENPNMLVDWSAFSEHGKQRMAQRHMNTEDIDQIVQHGFTLSQNNGNKFVFITKNGVVILDKSGKLITNWGSSDFDNNMIKILKKLIGDE